MRQNALPLDHAPFRIALPLDHAPFRIALPLDHACFEWLVFAGDFD